MGKHKKAACQICFKHMRSDNLKIHEKIHVKYSNETSQSTEDMCRVLILEIVDKVVGPEEVISGMKQKHEVVECEAQTTIDEEALEQSALKIQREFEEKTELGKALESNFSLY